MDDALLSLLSGGLSRIRQVRCREGGLNAIIQFGLFLLVLVSAVPVSQLRPVVARPSSLTGPVEMTRATTGRLAHHMAAPLIFTTPVDAGPVEIQTYTLDDASGGDGDGLADPGEAISLTLTLVNRGQDPLLGVQAMLDSASPHVTLIHTSTVLYGDLSGGGSQTAAQPVQFWLGDDAPEGQTIIFTLTISATGAGPWLDELALPVGYWQTYLPLVFNNYVQARVPNDAYYPSLWAPPLIEAPKAWGITTGDPSVVIAILDTGVDLDHPDLVGKLWVNADEVPNNGLDDDGNGFVDDWHGYDFWYGDADPSDDHGHGTHVSGIAAAATDNEIGVAALGWHSSFMPLKTQSRNGWGTTNELVEAIGYAVDNGASVINMSVGQELTLCPAALQAAIDYADAHGVLVVAAVGNQDLEPDKDFYPAACENVLAVAATTSWDGRIGSDYGTYVDVAAPGHDIQSTLDGGSYGSNSGTSMATPLVSGLAALLYAHYPYYGDEQVAWAILGHAVDLGSPGKDVYFGWGRINAYRTVANGATSAPEYKVGSRGTGEPGRENYAPGELLLGMRATCGVEMLVKQVFATPDVRVLDGYPHLGIWRVAVPVGQELTYLERWQNDTCVTLVELNYVFGVAE
jgi:subtilisin family serine protease